MLKLIHINKVKLLDCCSYWSDLLLFSLRSVVLLFAFFCNCEGVTPMDIKYVHIHGTGRNALLLTVIDIYSIKALVHLLRMSIKKDNVLLLLSLMLLEYKAEKMSWRNDNGSQFIAHAVRKFLREKNILQEFPRVATPEDNAFVEALHSDLQQQVIDRFKF